jgi:HEPN domain-containing protein
MDRPESDWVTDALCFHSQQAVEKSLKAFLIKNGTTPPRTHSVEMLVEFCRQVDSGFPE